MAKLQKRPRAAETKAVSLVVAPFEDRVLIRIPEPAEYMLLSPDNALKFARDICDAAVKVSRGAR